MRHKKFRGFILMLSAAKMLVFLLTLTGASIIGSMLITNMQAGHLKGQCDVIDRSLEKWSSYHVGVDTDTVTYDEKTSKLRYQKCKLYPASLDELGVIVDQGFFSEKIDLSIFKYSTTTNVDGSMSYQLEVTLPDGTKYISAGSNQS